MGKKIHKIGKLYSGIIMRNIGILIFVGLLSVVFQEHGWLPNKDIYAISQLTYSMLLPAFISYEGGRSTGGQTGGILAVLAVSGFIAADNGLGMFGAMLLGPLAGVLWTHSEAYFRNRAKAGMKMLVGNLWLVILGTAMAVLGFYLLAPMIEYLMRIVSACVNGFTRSGRIGILSIITEPAKVFFMNNMINHGILVPLGMNQVQETGKSVLFLLETNPGPGLGVLASLYYMDRNNKEKRNEYITAMAAEAAGGIHEVYFPFVLANLWLLLPLIAGGVSGSLCFEILGAGIEGPVSPGSIFIILLMAGKAAVPRVAAGILISSLVSFAAGILVLKLQKRRKNEGKGKDPKKEITKETAKEQREKEQIVMPIHNVAFVCDGGMGSSAMAASLFRRRLRQEQIEGIGVEAYASDMISKEADIIVCQKDFYELQPEKWEGRRVCVLESILSAEGYDRVIEEIQKGRKG